MVGYTEAIHFDDLSAFCPCDRDLVEFFNSAVWAFYGQVAVPMRLPDAGRLRGTARLASRDPNVMLFPDYA